MVDVLDKAARSALMAKVRQKNTAPELVVRRDVWTAPNFADSTSADRLTGEDPQVRRAAVDALGEYNGSIVVTEADTGRVLSIVNQRLAFQSGYIPCSTVKLYAAMASLLEGHIDRNTEIPIARHTSLTLTDALAHSTIRFGLSRFTTAEEIEFAAGKVVTAAAALRAEGTTA